MGGYRRISCGCQKKWRGIVSAGDRDQSTTREGTDIEFVANLGVRFQLAVQRSVPVITDQSTMFRLDGILAHDLRIDDSEE